MKVFGEANWGPALEPGAELVPTPVGQKCLLCDEPIAVGDRGVMTVLIETDPATMMFRYEQPVPEHRECLLRAVLGSVAHQRHECSCYGGTRTDGEEGLTKRQAALQAVEEFERSQEHGTHEPVPPN